MLNSIRFIAICFSALVLVGSGNVTAQVDGTVSAPLPKEAQEVEDFWTPERIANAQPMPTPTVIITNTAGQPIYQDTEYGIPTTISGPSPVTANDEVTICHVQPKHNQTEPFASGRVITIPREDCYDHCNDHGGDQPMFSTACTAAPFDSKTCIVNSPEPNCSTEICFAGCSTDCGDCFEDRGDDTAGCEISDCEASVCAVDSYCCEFGWDSLCVLEAIQICAIDNDYCAD